MHDSPASEARRWRHPFRGVAALPRLAAGPLALAGFFLPWGAGPGPLAATQFTGYSLVGYAGRLGALDLGPDGTAILWAARLVVLGIAVTAAWMTLLAPILPRHAAYRASGWYLVAATAALLAIGAWRAGLVLPPPGLLLLAAGAACFAARAGLRLPHWMPGRASRGMTGARRTGVERYSV